MYITSADGLRQELEHRRTRREEIREKTRAFLLRRYGLEEIPNILPPPIWQEAQSKTVAILARQVASVCIEDITFEVGAKKLGLRPVTLTFSRDVFTAGNHDKLRRVEIPWYSWSVNGAQDLVYERISPLSNTELTGMPLGAIVCRNDKKLPLLHKDLRKAMFLEGTTYDVSTIHNRILRDATRLPSFVYRIEETKEKRVELAKGDALLSHDRPPSSWYYPYYLSWFLDGTSVLFETYDNPLGEVSRAKELFEECMKTIESVTGFRPLVVKIPPLSHELLYCNRHFLWRHHALSQLQETAERFESNDTVSLFNEIAQTITRFR